MYKHFDQLIFFDLNIKTMEFSDDGSHEFIKNFPDPENKITLIEKKNLDDITDYRGISFIQKRQMFAEGSKYVRDDMDVFWCTDMDEFFEESLIRKVEDYFNTTDKATIIVPHIVFFKNEKYVFTRNEKDGERWPLPWARITRHKKGNIYGHCSLNQQFGPVGSINDDQIFHFSYVGYEKIRNKLKMYGHAGWVADIWEKFKESNLRFVGPYKIHGFPKMHPAVHRGIKLNTAKIPSYINVKEMIKDLK